MTELDKFKRRLIRSVARRIMQEGQPEDEVWEDLQKQTGCDCKLLWQRMHALTIKKLKRLLAVSDRPECVSTIARMSATDWLLYDLVLVLEKIDVIDVENIKVKGERQALKDLFDLVVSYDIESLSGNQLADAWEKLAAEYNSSGRRCSPILLQSRWYQMKELTRKSFYQLWFTYRGNQRNWDQAVDDVRPTELQSCIAKRFPNVVTEAFVDWDTLIQQKKIILKEDFEIKKIRQVAKPNDDKPDLEMIEPKIDIIAIDSDEDSNEGNANLSSDYNASVAIKKEKIGDDVKEPPFQAMKQISSQEVNLSLVKREKTDEPNSQTNVEAIATNTAPNITRVENIINDSLKKLQMQKTITIASRKINNEEKEVVGKKPSSKIENFKQAIIDGIVVENVPIKPTDSKTIDNLKKAIIKDIVIEKRYRDSDDNMECALIKPTETEKIENFKNAIIKGIVVGNDSDVKNAPIKPTVTEKDIFIEVTPDPHEDLVKQKMNEYLLSVGQVSKENVDANSKDEVDVISKQNSEKRMMNKQESNQYETELPNGVSFDDDGVDIVDDGLEIVDDGIPEESEDVNTINNREELDDMVKTEIEIDIKLKLKPIVYTTKLDKMNVLKDKLCAYIEKKELIDAIAVESKPISNLNIKVEKKDEKNNEKQDSITLDENIDDDTIPRVKPTSLMLQKPKHCTYNSVQVCKNPDFNTRLKRLTAGFFCSPRNRRLLNTCKPLTIDLTKAFESRLVDGTLYLKRSLNASVCSLSKENLVHATSVMSSTMPAQSLISNQTAYCHTERLNKAPSQPPFNLSAGLLAARNNVIRDLEIPNVIQQVVTCTEESVPKKSTAEIASAKTSTGIAQLQAALLKDIGKLNTCNNDDSKIPETDRLLGFRDTNPLKYTLTIDDKNVPDAENILLKEKVGNSPVNSFITKVGDSNDEKNQDRPRSGPNMGQRLGPNIGPRLGQTIGPRFGPNIGPRLGQTIGPRFGPNIGPRFGPNIGPRFGPNIGPRVGPNIGPKRFSAKNSRISFNQLPGRVVDCAWNIKSKSKLNLPEDGLLTIDTLSRMIHKLNGVDIPAKSSKNKDSLCPRGRKKKEYCCWASEKAAMTVLRREATYVHNCEDTQLGKCVCCCRVNLANVLKSRIWETQSQPPSQQGHESVSAPVDQSQPTSVDSTQATSVDPTPVDPAQPTSVDPAQPTSVDPAQHSSVEPAQPAPESQSIDIQPQDAQISETEQVVAPAPVKKRQRKRNAKTQTGVDAVFDDDVPKIPKLRVYSGTPRAPAKRSRQTDPRQSQCMPMGASVVQNHKGTQQIENLYHKIPQVQNQHLVQLPNQTQEKPLLRVNVKLVPDTAVPEITMVPIEPTPILDLTQTDSPSLHPLQKPICPTPVIDPIKKKIIIDGTLPSPQKKNFIFLRNDKPKDIPIFLGKNKVLLTTVEFPPYLMDGEGATHSPQTEITCQETPSVINPPVLSVPAGVQLVMMADGKLTYAVDPNTVLTESEQATLKSVVDLVQSQIDATRAQVPLSENVPAVDSILQTCLTPVTDIASANVANTNMQVSHSGIATVEETSTLNANTANVFMEDSSYPDTIQTAEMPNAGGEKRQEKTSNSLLSDLMQMSGISAEDTALTNQQISSPTSVTEIQASTVVTTDLAQLPRLHPITSVKQLKYACHHNGKFFKLDVTTGVIVPIHVSVKRNVSEPPSISPKKLAKAVIDLTDDGTDKSPIDDSNELARPNILKVNRDLRSTLPPQPVKLFKTAFKNKHSLLKQVNPGEINAERTRKRKQNLQKIEARIDLVDSDAPMEEEYLLNSDSDDSAESREFSSNVIINVDINEDNDSSDDEPLASKSVRMRSHNVVPAPSIERVVNEQHDMDSKVNPRSVVATQPEAALEADEEMPASPMEIEETPLIPFLQSYTESQDEDCILGV